MARANTKAAETTQVNSWEKDLAEQAAASFEQEKNSAGTGQFFGLGSGILSYEGVNIPGNRMAVIILDSVMENVHFEGAYDKANPANPDCFAFGRNEKEMEPHESVEEPYSEMCGRAGQPGCCPNNEWDTAIRQDGSLGKGKACKNTRRLSMIPAGSFIGDVFQQITDEGHFADAKAGYMKLPVTSVKGYAGYVAELFKAHQRPPHGMITLVTVVQDKDTQFRVEFEAIAKVPNELMETIMARHKKAKGEIMFPYQPPVVKPEPAATPARGKAAPAAPARRSKF